jgi:hypothetical protein
LIPGNCITTNQEVVSVAEYGSGEDDHEADDGGVLEIGELDAQMREIKIENVSTPDMRFSVL